MKKKSLILAAFSAAFFLFFSPSADAATLSASTIVDLQATNEDADGYKVVTHTIGDTTYVLVAAGEGGLQIYTYTEDGLALTKTVETTASARDVIASGNYAYVGTHFSGVNGHVYVVDITDPSSAAIVGDYPKAAASFRSLELNGSRLYAGDNVSGINVLDVSDPTNPELEFLQALTAGANITDIEYADGKVYSMQPGIGVLYVHTDAGESMTLDKTWFVDSTATELLVRESTVYVSNGEDGVEFIDVDATTEEQLVTQQQLNTPGTLQSVDFIGTSNLLFAADDSAGVKLISADSASTAKIVGTSTVTSLEGAIDSAVATSALFSLSTTQLIQVDVNYDFEVSGSKSSKKEKVTVTESGETWCTIPVSDKKVGAQAFLADVDGDGKDHEIIEAPKSKLKKPRVRIYSVITCELVKKKKIDDSDKKREYKVRAGNYYGSDSSRDEIVAVRAYSKDEKPKVQLRAFFYNVDSNKIKLKKKKAHDGKQKYVNQGFKLKVKEGTKYPVLIQAKEDTDTKDRFRLKKKDGEFKWQVK